MKRLYKILSLALVCSSVFFYSCETLELDLTENPNALTPSDADVDFYLNAIQEDFVRQLAGDGGFGADTWSTGGSQRGDGFHDYGMTLTRIYNIAGRDYASMLQPGDGDDEWRNAYAEIMIDIKNMMPLAETAELSHHIAIARFIQAYTLVTLVDFFGDVPLTEALLGADNLAPSVDGGAAIYDTALSLIDNAITLFGTDAPAEPQYDFFYGGDEYGADGNWVKACNTLKMKIYLQRRLVDGSAKASFDAIVTAGDYIQDSSEDFEYTWPGTSASNPDTRHPSYGLNYQAAGANDYMSNWMMNLMDSRFDPRIRYYFFRQTDAVPGSSALPPDEELLNCSLETPPLHYIEGGFTFCYLENGYWGRDHGDNDGIPPDGLLRTTWGVYPAGGRFDDSRFTNIGIGDGGNGAGITPILSAMYVDFYKAEFAMVGGDPAAAKQFMMDGTTKSISKVQTFGALDSSADLDFYEPSDEYIETFLTNMSDAYDAGNEKDKWNIMSELYWVAVFGNGVEPYNYYRRTGYPTTLQPNLEPNPGTFMRSLWYPNNLVNNNASVSQKADQAQPVFWDNNPSAPEAN